MAGWTLNFPLYITFIEEKAVKREILEAGKG
jgi:hypothetical protein